MISQISIPPGASGTIHGPVFALRVVAYSDGSTIAYERGAALPVRALSSVSWTGSAAPERIDATAGAAGPLVLEWSARPGVVLHSPAAPPAPPPALQQIQGTVLIANPPQSIEVSNQRAAPVMSRLRHGEGVRLDLVEGGAFALYQTTGGEQYRIAVVGGPVQLDTPTDDSTGQILPDGFVGDVHLPAESEITVLSLATTDPVKVSIVPIDGWAAA